MTDRDILTVVAEEYGVTVRQITQGLRFRDVSDARQMYMYVLRSVRRYGLEVIAELVNRTHSTVIYGIRQVCDRLAADRETRRHHAAIISRIR